MKKISLLIIAIIIAVASNAQTNSDIKCRLWKPKSYCDIPDTLTSVSNSICQVCIMNELSCSGIDSLKDKAGVWLTIPSKYGSSFKIKSRFKNISLVKKSNCKKNHPCAILNFYDTNYKKKYKKNIGYISKVLKAIGFTVYLKNDSKVDLILIFPEAEIGDKIIIKNYIQAEIKN